MGCAWEDIEVLADDEVLGQATFSWTLGYLGVLRTWNGTLTLIPGDGQRPIDLTGLTGRTLTLRDRRTGRTVNASAEQRPMGQSRHHVSVTGHGPPPDIS